MIISVCLLSSARAHLPQHIDCRRVVGFKYFPRWFFWLLPRRSLPWSCYLVFKLCGDALSWIAFCLSQKQLDHRRDVLIAPNPVCCTSSLLTWLGRLIWSEKKDYIDLKCFSEHPHSWQIVQPCKITCKNKNSAHPCAL